MTPTKRPDHYRRTRDGFRVIAADWPDGSVSWMLDPAPIIAERVVGTCSVETFEKTHDRIRKAPCGGSRA